MHVREEFCFFGDRYSVAKMKTTRWLVCLLALLTAGPLCAADASVDAALEIAERALRPVLEKLDPKAEVTRPDGGSTLLVAHKAQMYKIHGHSMTGEISPEAYDYLGPGFKGFVLRVHVQEAGVVNQAATPQILKEPYWQTYLDVTPLAGTKKQFFWSLSYGGRADPDLLAEIRQKLGDLNDAKGKPGNAMEEKTP